MEHQIFIKRIYCEKEEKDGYRMLVDKLWPRGISKAACALDEWNKEIAPSAALRKWFGHDPEKFKKFSELYMEELLNKKEELLRIKDITALQNLTLLYAAKNTTVNHARVLVSVLEKI